MKKTVNLFSKNNFYVNWKFGSVFILFLASLQSFGQTEEAPVKIVSEFPKWLSDPSIYFSSGIIFILLVTVYVLYKANAALSNLLYPNLRFVETKKKNEKTVVEKKPSFLRKAYLKMIDSVPVEKEKDILLDHDYDGIKELDNNLPPWWKYGFYVTIVFAFFYLVIYVGSGVGKSQKEEYNDELVLAATQKEERMRMNAEFVNEDNVVLLVDPALVGNGKATFEKYCVACHKSDGGGQVGPNLTDEFWLHGGGIKNIFKTITYGVPNKGMLSWKSQLSPKQIQEVASYVTSLKGTNPVGGKEPQGDKWIEETTTLDTVATNKLKIDSLKSSSIK